MRLTSWSLAAVLCLVMAPAVAEATESSLGVSVYGGIAGVLDGYDGTPLVSGFDVDHRWTIAARTDGGSRFGAGIGFVVGGDFAPGVVYGRTGFDLWLLAGIVEIRVKGMTGWRDQKTGNFPDLGFPLIFTGRIEIHVLAGDFRVITGLAVWDNLGLGSENPGAAFMYLGVGLRFY